MSFIRLYNSCLSDTDVAHQALACKIWKRQRAVNSKCAPCISDNDALLKNQQAARRPKQGLCPRTIATRHGACGRYRTHQGELRLSTHQALGRKLVDLLTRTLANRTAILQSLKVAVLRQTSTEARVSGRSMVH